MAVAAVPAAVRAAACADHEFRSDLKIARAPARVIFCRPLFLRVTDQSVNWLALLLFCCGPLLFGSTEWNIDLAADSTSWAMLVV